MLESRDIGEIGRRELHAREAQFHDAGNGLELRIQRGIRLFYPSKIDVTPIKATRELIRPGASLGQFFDRLGLLGRWRWTSIGLFVLGACGSAAGSKQARRCQEEDR